MNIYETTSEAYLGLMSDVMDNPEFICAPRGQDIKEILNYSVRIKNPQINPLITKDLKRNLIIENYTDKELKWYLSASVDVDDAVKISKFWGKLVNPDGKTINSNYGYLLFKDRSEGHPEFSANNITPYEWGKQSLLRDKDSRQAIMRVNKSKHCFETNKDFVCTMYLNFHIRDNKLNCTTRMRSSDLYVGIVYDWPFFIYVQHKLLQELRSKYNDLELGYFTFSTDSLHIYERNFGVINKMLGRDEI